MILPIFLITKNENTKLKEELEKLKSKLGPKTTETGAPSDHVSGVCGTSWNRSS